MATTLSLVLVYTILHTETSRRAEEQHKLLVQKELELEDSRIRVMLSQIQPHFLFNTLNSIYHLCPVDAEKAQQAIAEFSDYLRGNLSSLSLREPVPFETELDCVQHYLYLEKMRFEEELTVVYDIQAHGFLLPVLTVQPLAENAVKHGLCRKPGGGTLRIASREYPEHYEVIIADDGVGFDPVRADGDERIHIGIENTKRRLWAMNHSTLTVQSRLGEGTTATIRIRKEPAAE